MKQEKFTINHFEPVKIKKELYGNTIEFDHSKRYIKFTSNFHDPDYIYYDQIKKMTVKYDKKRLLLWLGIATLLLFIGVFILLIRTNLPSWEIIIELKKETKPISIRARLVGDQASDLVDFCTPKFPTILLIALKK